MYFLLFATSLGRNGSVVNWQEGHPIHHLCAFGMSLGGFTTIDGIKIDLLDSEAKI
jgi:hypothetical protein